MNFDPQKFFIGMMDFFSILLPGAALVVLLMVIAHPATIDAPNESLWANYAAFVDAGGARFWAAFLFASYLLGHLVFLLGSWLDELYDWARRHTLNVQIKRVARRGRLLDGFARALVWMVFKGERNLAVDRAGEIKRKMLGPLQAKNAVNTFQWSKALLNVESPASLAVVQRFEADSKFFRCFTVVLLILLIVWPWLPWPPIGIPIVLALLVLALWRYMEQRHKATNQAYWAVITLTARDGKVVPDSKTAPEGRPSHAGGVVVRMRDRKVEYLLVEASKDPDAWVLPKGHIEADEPHRETAVREVYEETGVWARVVGDLGNEQWMVGDDPVTTHFFQMRELRGGQQQDTDRRHLWLSLEDAVATATHTDTRALLRRATSRLVSGVVQQGDGRPLPGLRVRATHEATQGPVALGEDTTDAQGRYSIRYGAPSGVATINLRTSAIGDDGRRLVASAIVHNAEPEETINLAVR